MANGTQPKKVKNLPAGCLKLVFWTIPKWIVISHLVVIGIWLVVGFLVGSLLSSELGCNDAQGTMECLVVHFLAPEAVKTAIEDAEATRAAQTPTPQPTPIRVDSLNPNPNLDSTDEEPATDANASPTPIPLGP